MNKFKVGDRVKSILKKEYYGVRYGDIGTVQEDSQYPFVRWDRTEKTVSFNEKDLIKLYTYEDLKKSPVGTKVTFEDGRILIKAKNDNINDSFTDIDGFRSIMDLKGLKDSWNGGYYGKIIKIEEPTYETVYEAKAESEILDEVEKRYLKGVIGPFKNKTKYIVKYNNSLQQQYIVIYFSDNNGIVFPEFEKGTMYKGMKVDKKYTLEELGI